MSFLLNNCHFSVLDAAILASSNSFFCGNPDLDDFFRNEAILYARELLGKTYCFIDDKKPSEIVCAFTVSNDSIKTHTLPNSRRKQVAGTIPFAKRKRSYPAVLVGRLGVNQNYAQKGIGSELMDFIKTWFVGENNKTGCRFIVVDAYNTTQTTSFYRKNEFKVMFSSEEQEKKYFGIAADESLMTRLMFFDLIEAIV